MFFLPKTASAVSCVKANASQGKATLLDDVGFPTVYSRILSQMSDVIQSDGALNTQVH